MSVTVRVLGVLLLASVWTQPVPVQGRRGGAPARGQSTPGVPKGVNAYVDLQYAIGDGRGSNRQRLDLYVPAKAAGPIPVVLWIHGGGWAQGNKSNPVALPLTTKGFAVASIEYRLSQHARFPAQIEDCKAAVRWLRASAGKYGLDTERFAVWGSSAGGHLAALLGTAGDASDLEGTGGNLEQSSRVQAVVDWFGPTDLLQMGGSHDKADSFESRLIGGPIRENKEKAARANPIVYIGTNTPPFLIMHGTSDTTVPIGQSEILASALKRAHVDVTMVAVKGARHGAGGFATVANMRIVEDFLTKHLIAGKTSGK